MKTFLYLIRHGQTELNLQKRYCGLIDAELNAEGRRQAECLGKKLSSRHWDNVLASDRKRAIQTAQLALPRTPQIEQLCELREINFGVFEGLTHEEILARHPDVYRRWLDDPFGAAIPQGETLDEFGRRVNEALQGVLCRYRGKSVAVVTHGGVISMYLNGLRNTRDFWKTIPHSASISIVESAGDGHAECVLFDDTGHLGGGDA